EEPHRRRKAQSKRHRPPDELAPRQAPAHELVAQLVQRPPHRSLLSAPPGTATSSPPPTSASTSSVLSTRPYFNPMLRRLVRWSSSSYEETASDTTTTRYP